jgi:DNA-binding XRE family transcriptional regulator
MVARSSRSPVKPKERVEKLSHLLRERFPGIGLETDAPSKASGDWLIDTKLGDQSFVIAFRPTLGFGLSSTPSEGIGEGPDEFLADDEAVLARLATLVSAGRRTEPQRVRLLQELRERQQVSQVALADKLGVRQPTISKIERREDVQVATLRRYVRALGGELHITARFPDGTVEIGPPSDRDEARAGR